jgi:hypothetical protein
MPVDQIKMRGKTGYFPIYLETIEENTMNNIHTGLNFDNFLKEEGLLADVEATAIKGLSRIRLNKRCRNQTSQKLRLHTRCTQAARHLTDCSTQGMFL